MEDEIEDLVGEVKYTDSQKSVTPSNVYSLDFTDSSSDKTDRHNSSGKDTYVIDYDSDDSDKTFPLLNHTRLSKTQSVVSPAHVSSNISASILNIPPTETKHDACMQYESSINTQRTTSVHKCSYLAQETFTQTSKTILELAACEHALRNCHKNLETQTSLVSITENRTFEYKIEIAETCTNITDNKSHFHNGENITTREFYNLTGNPLINKSLDDSSSKFPISRSESRAANKSGSSSNSEVINIINDYSEENFSSDDHNEHENYKDLSDSSLIDEDSLMEKCDQQQDEHDDSISDATSLCNEVDEFYNKLSQRIGNSSPERSCDSKSQEDLDGTERRLGILTPLTEESTKKDSEVLLDITPNDAIIQERTEKRENNSSRMPQESNTNHFKLPPITSNTSNPDCGHFKYTVSINPLQKLSQKAMALKCLYDGQDRWEITSKELASGESMLISGRSITLEEREKISIQLPPIEGQFKSPSHPNAELNVKGDQVYINSKPSISIKKRIKELTMGNNDNSPIRNQHQQSRSCSPSSAISPKESRLGDVADRGCEALCLELLRRLRSSSWMETAETLEDMPKVLEKFWLAMSENRIADLIRQVSAHVESPRTQVSRTACTTLASIIKNTKYTKKPDFYEAVTTLLIKTGSFSRPVRTAANLALDEIVCDVDLTHCVTALCLHGVGHKSGLVRGAASRLLVVCCALAGGGRELLRARPPSAANARRLVLQALATLLCDKNTDVRKYAERLYTMLRPLSNFEAFYLTDVDVEVATSQMKKYDQALSPKHSR